MAKQITKIGIECESIEEDSYGIARIVTKLLQEIASRPELQNEFKFYLYFKSKIPDHPFLNNPIFEKKIVRVPGIPTSFSLYYYVFLPIKLWFEGLDLMFFTNYMLPIIFIGKSLVFTTHDAYYEARSKNVSLRYRLAYRIFCTWAAWRATKLLAISDFGKQELAKVYDINPSRIEVNHLAVDQTGTRGEKKPYFLFAAQAFPRRHLKETLLAFEKIAPEFPDLKFIAVGPDKYTPECIDELVKEINERLGTERIIRKARVSDDELASLYSHALAVAYVSSKEAFGLPPMEGLANGAVPVIADNQLSRELFGNNGSFVSEPFSVDAIAHAMRSVLTNETKRNEILNNKEVILQRFTWKAHTDRFLNVARIMTHHAK